MHLLVTDLDLQSQLRAQRQAAGSDRFDEVWEGTYVMNPLPNDEHQKIVGRLFAAFDAVLGLPGQANVRPGVNVSDRKDDWMQNYRCPDVAVFMADTKAENCDTFWYGGPDFAVEIISPGDRSREKLDFYAAVGTRELLFIDRDPWQLELYRLQDGQLRRVAMPSKAGGERIESQVLPFTFRLANQQPRPAIEVVHTAGSETWRI